MSNPIAVLESVGAGAAALDDLDKALDVATVELDAAEEAWDELYDAVAESLISEYQEAGRKSDPAEHTITTATRRAHRVAYQRLRRAKRSLDRLEKQLQARRASLSGRQSELAAMRDEARLAS